MKIKSRFEANSITKASLAFLFVVIVLIIAMVITSFFPEAIELYIGELRLFFICCYISWWLNNINVLRTTKNKGWYWFSILLSTVVIIQSMAVIVFFIIAHYQIFNIIGTFKLWKWHHPDFVYAMDFLFYMTFVLLLFQYVINTVIIIRGLFISPKQ
jgi:hypothetical protein